MKEHFLAYVDQMDTIEIETNIAMEHCYLNGQYLPMQFFKKNGDIYFYQAHVLLDFAQEYTLRDIHFHTTPLQYRYVVKTKEFDDLFYYDENDLGPTYHKEATSFKLWAPIANEVYLQYYQNNKIVTVTMQRGEKGVYHCQVFQDLEGVAYHYLCKRNGAYVKVNDPYAYTGTANFKESVIVDLEKLKRNMYDQELPPFYHYNEAILYEINVRDFTSSTYFQNVKQTFAALTITNLKNEQQQPIGIDYLQYLGVSHVQLMPVFDFATVDEENKQENYNWGYDPVSFSVLEGSYSTNPQNGKQRLKEFLDMVAAFHHKGIRVNLDIVWNHVYHKESFLWNQILPHYFFLIDKIGTYSNGSFCGNDIDTNQKMVQKYLLDMAKRCISLFHIDGFRLDLMGIFHYQFVNLLYDECKKLKADFMIYGEGWNMPSILPESQRATLNNRHLCPNIAFFNDYFRDVMKGKAFHDTLSEKGYLNGNSYFIELAAIALKGSVDKNCYFQDACQSINYLECHDNMTLFDKYKVSNANLTEKQINCLQMTSIAAILFSLGVPFLHSGMELKRSKHGVFNSYNSGDEINHFPWENLSTCFYNVQALKEMIEIRKHFKTFLLHTEKDIQQHFRQEKIGNDILKITFFDLYSIDKIEEIVCIFNNTMQETNYQFSDIYQLICTQNGKTSQYLKEYRIPEFSFSMFIKKGGK